MTIATTRPGTPSLLVRAPLVFSGIALGFSFPPFDLYYLAWFALFPLFHNWKQSGSVRETLVDAYVTFGFATATVIWWPLAHERFQVALASLGGILLLPLLFALPFAASKALSKHQDVNTGWITLISSFLVIELALSRGPFAFPWLLLGHSQSMSLSLNQFAELGGVPALTLWVLLLNLIIFRFFSVRSNRDRVVFLLALSFLFLIPFGFSRYRLSVPHEPVWYMTIGLIQPGIVAESWADQTNLDRLNELLQLTDSLWAQAVEKPELFIWPETAIPAHPDEKIRSQVYNRLSRWSDSTQIPLLTGAIIAGDDSRNTGTFYNSAIMFKPGSQRDRYDKQWLVPYAEHVPLSTYFPFATNWTVNSGGVRSYLRGHSQDLLEAKGVQSGVLICFESLFGNYTRRYVEKGAHLLIALTQDGWWGRTPGHIQHFAFTRLRAIETRRTVVQVSVSGMTGIFLPDGTVAQSMDWMQRGGINGKVPVHTIETVYTRWGDWISVVAVLLAFGSYSRVFFIRKRHKANV